MKTTFETVIRGFGNNAGIEVPPENITALGKSKVPPVIVDVSGYTYKSTVAVMGGRFMISFPKAHREISGFAAGDAVTITLTLDDGPRTVEVPQVLQDALKKAGYEEIFAKLAYSTRKEFARQVMEAKAEETRDRRITKILSQLAEKA